MHNVAAVAVLDALQRARQELPGPLLRDWTVLEGRSQRPALRKLHDEIKFVVNEQHLNQVDDVFVLDSLKDTNLFLDALDLRYAGELGSVHNLDCHLLLARVVPGDAHGAAGPGADDAPQDVVAHAASLGVGDVPLHPQVALRRPLGALPPQRHHGAVGPVGGALLAVLQHGSRERLARVHRRVHLLDVLGGGALAELARPAAAQHVLPLVPTQALVARAEEADGVALVAGLGNHHRLR
mmetsp:Transcript_18702/g.35627  ORF Transcript_18702/g.35627 Transcript_18702/m.35627 type:complete len:239 (-) Transcript_18702:839-1555(-)